MVVLYLVNYPIYRTKLVFSCFCIAEWTFVHIFYTTKLNQVGLVSVIYT